MGNPQATLPVKRTSDRHGSGWGIFRLAMDHLRSYLRTHSQEEQQFLLYLMQEDEKIKSIDWLIIDA